MFNQLWKTAESNSVKVLKALKEVRLAESDLWGSTGYGLDDFGREKLEKAYAYCFGAEASLVRPNISSGTHVAYLVAMSLDLAKKKVAFSPCEPYDSVFENIKHLLWKWVVWDLNDEPVNADVLWLQRSGGYRWHEGLNIDELRKAIDLFRSLNPDAVIVVDNCYGEFVEDLEPSQVGADIVFGSLIKNLGGTVTPTGAYVAGKKELVDKVSEVLFGPALAKEQGATGNFLKGAFQGLFLAPIMVYNALLSKQLMLERLNNTLKERFPFSDIIVRTRWDDEEHMLAAAQIIQSTGPVNSHVSPTPFEMGGYADPIVMAWTGFIQGESLSLSADGTVKPPYELFIQPGVNPFIIEGLSAELKSLL